MWKDAEEQTVDGWMWVLLKAGSPPSEPAQGRAPGRCFTCGSQDCLFKHRGGKRGRRGPQGHGREAKEGFWGQKEAADR